MTRQTIHESPCLAAERERRRPRININVEIHIPPDSSAELIESICMSMARHLYGVDDSRILPR